MPSILYLLCGVNFVIGTGAFVIGGILGPIAQALGTTVPAAGQAMTAYALATALLAPLVLLASGRLPRKQVLLGALVLFTAGNAVCALAESLPVLLAGRVLMGVGAVFTAVAAGIAVALVPPARRGKALALTFLGISLSYVAGLPVGAWLGLTYGWHAPIWAVTALSVLALAAVALWVPAGITSPGASMKGLRALVTSPPVRWTLLLTWLYFTAIFSVFAYIGPVLLALVPMAGPQLSLTLMLFGLAGVAGTLSGGWANDRFGPGRTLTAQLTVLAAMMLLVPLTVGRYPALVAVFVVWGIAGFGMMAPQQSRLAALAPAQAPMLLSLNTSMLYLGTAGGAAVGGVAASRIGLSELAWAGFPFALAGLAALWLSMPKRAKMRPA
ncbi:MAG: MFS transporter [Chitinophagaceae bacterium]|nr:MFS transporter [Rubrivivax sp.]